MITLILCISVLSDAKTFMQNPSSRHITQIEPKQFSSNNKLNYLVERITLVSYCTRRSHQSTAACLIMPSGSTSARDPAHPDFLLPLWMMCILLCTNMSPWQRAETGLWRESTRKCFVLFSLRLRSVAEDRPLVMNAREENHSVQKQELCPLKHSELSNNASFTRILVNIF